MILCFNDEQREKHLYNSRMYSCSYETCHGKTDGHYISYFKNGTKKAEGDFENNYRIGKWTVWDSTGHMVLQREYENPFFFKCLYPKPQTNVPDSSQYRIQYNKEGYIDYFKLKEEMVVWSKRLWRFVPESKNLLNFDNGRLFQNFQKNIQNKNIIAYSVADDEFKTALTSDQIPSSNLRIIGFKIKEDAFTDNIRKVLETRIIGICPVVINTVKKDTSDLYWLYYPELRPILAKEKLEAKFITPKIKSFDDLFFFRNFSSSIYKESNVYNRSIADYKKGVDIEREAEKIEIGIIEYEYDCWVWFLKH